MIETPTELVMITIKIEAITPKQLVAAIDSEGDYYLLWQMHTFPELRAGDLLTAESFSTAPAAYIHPKIARLNQQATMTIEDWGLSRQQAIARMRLLG